MSDKQGRRCSALGPRSANGSRKLTVAEVLEKVLLAREVQLHLDADGERGHLARLQGKLGQGFLQLPAQEVTVQLFCNDNNSAMVIMSLRRQEAR